MRNKKFLDEEFTMLFSIRKQQLAVLFILFITVILPNLHGCRSFNGADARNSEGVIYFQQGRYDQALENFHQAIQMDPNNAEAYYNLASTYQKQAGRLHQPALFVQAENYYRACLDHKPSPNTTVCCYRGLATIMNDRKQGDQALAMLKSWESRNPSALDPKLEIAYLFEAQGRNQEALATLQSASTIAPNDYRVYYKTGVIQQKLGRSKEALDQFMIAGRLKPSDAEIANRISHLRTTAGVQLNTNQLASQAVPGAKNSVVPSAPSVALANNNTGAVTSKAPPISTTAPSLSRNDQLASNAGNPKSTINIQTTSAATNSFPTYNNSLTNSSPVQFPNNPTPKPAVSQGNQTIKETSPIAGTQPKLPDGTGASTNPFERNRAKTAASTAPSLPGATPNSTGSLNRMKTIGNGPPTIGVGSGL